MSATTTNTAHLYTCNTCQVAYRIADLQKGHMKSDWHRYNLKRRVASLPPIASEVFTEKVLQARAASTAQADRATFERSCDVCQKTYYSENAYQNHLSSQKHKARWEAASSESVGPRGAPGDEASSTMSSTFSLGNPLPGEKGDKYDSDAEDEFIQVVEGLQSTNLSERPSPVKRPSNPEPRMQPDDHASGVTAPSANGSAAAAAASTWSLKSCLFCNYSSPTVPLNAHHMERFHGMFIPGKEYLLNLEGLLRHLEERVHNDHQCLYCGKVKSSAYAIQTHMRDKAHCMIPHTTLEEQLDIGDFYDFRATYSDEESDGDESVEGEQQETARVNGGNGEGDGWETDSSASSLDSADLTAVPAEGHIHQYDRLDRHTHHSRNDPRHHHQADGWHSHAHRHAHAVFYDEYELHLSTGKSVGHRSLNRYFRQNLNHYPTPEQRAERAAIEAAGSADHPEKRNRDNGQRAVVPRGQAGLLGVSAHKKRQVAKAAREGRSLQDFRAKRAEWAIARANNLGTKIPYRYGRGG